MYGGTQGDIVTFAYDMNNFFYEELVKIGAQNLAGPTGIIMMDRISNNANANPAGYYIPRIILANNPFPEGELLPDKKTTIPVSEHESILAAQDEESADKLANLYENICENHANKLEKVVELLNKRNEQKTAEEVKLACESVEEENLSKLEELADEFDKKLKQVQDECDKELEAEKARKVEILAESVERYLSYACSKHIPTKKLIAEHKYNTAMKSLNKVIDVLKVNNIIQESKDEFFEDINKQLEEAKEKQNQLINESIELKSQLASKKCSLLLEKTYAKCAPAEVMFIKNYFKNVNPDNICEESIKEARIAYKKLYTEKREGLKKDLNNSKAPSSIISESSYKEESVEPAQPVVEQKKETIDMYVDMLG
jgi:acetolactate synthase small subunit